MATVIKQLKQFFASIKLTVSLLFMLSLLILFATFAQVDLGIFEANSKYFTSWFIWFDFPLISIPIFLGGYTIGLLLVINLIMSHTTKFKFKRSYFGIFLIHVGLIILIIGSALTSWFAKEMQIAVKEGDVASYVEYPTVFELVFIDSAHSDYDLITAISLDDLLRKGKINFKDFTITLKRFYPNAYVNQRGILNLKYDQFGKEFKIISLPKTYQMDEKNIPAIDVMIESDSDSPLRYIFWGGMAIYQEYDANGTNFYLALRAKREYLPFKLELNDFSRELYSQTDIAESYVSKVSVLSNDGNVPFEISMNHPLRFSGYTFFQASFTDDEQTSVFQVVKNPSWLVPYISSLLIVLGLFFQMIFSMGRKRV